MLQVPEKTGRRFEAAMAAAEVAARPPRTPPVAADLRGRAVGRILAASISADAAPAATFPLPRIRLVPASLCSVLHADLLRAVAARTNGPRPPAGRRRRAARKPSRAGSRNRTCIPRIAPAS